MGNNMVMIFYFSAIFISPSRCTDALHKTKTVVVVLLWSNLSTYTCSFEVMSVMCVMPIFGFLKVR